MDEMYRMLGREHELDLEREARKRHLAAAVRATPGPIKAQTARTRRRPASLVPRRLAALLR
jgi:hypothetical protein